MNLPKKWSLKKNFQTENLNVGVHFFTLLQLKAIHFTFSAWFDQNELLWDLGMDVSFINNDTAIRNKIKSYYKEFDLVLIAERFDESLIVMKNFLCWDMQDILYLKVKSRSSEKLEV